jgi:hypothetical protein
MSYIHNLRSRLEEERDPIKCFSLSKKIRKALQYLSCLIENVEEVRRDRRMSYTNKIPSVLFGMIVEYLLEKERYTCSSVNSNWKSLIGTLCAKMWTRFSLQSWIDTGYKIALLPGNKIIEADANSTMTDTNATLAVSYSCDVEQDQDNFVLFNMKENLGFKPVGCNTYEHIQPFEKIISVSSPDYHSMSHYYKHYVTAYLQGSILRIEFKNGEGLISSWRDNSHDVDQDVIDDKWIIQCCRDHILGECLLVSSTPSKIDENKIYLYVIQDDYVAEKFCLNTYMEDEYLDEDSLCAMSDKFIYVIAKRDSFINVYYYSIKFYDEDDEDDGYNNTNVYVSFCHSIDIEYTQGVEATNMCACQTRIFLVYQGGRVNTYTKKRSREAEKKRIQPFLLVYHTNGQLLEKKKLDTSNFVVALSACFHKHKGYIVFIVYEDGSIDTLFSTIKN